MADSELDNPFWSSLCTRHRHLAIGAGGVARYPADIAPFLGVAATCSNAEAKIASLVAPDETVLVLGVAPELSSAWQLERQGDLAQMIRTGPIDMLDGPAIMQLSEAHRSDVLALTAQVYPHYFRPRTMEMGRYFGIYREGRLAAMIGERLGTETHVEMSAICTHPDFVGHGYARRLIAFLTNVTIARDQVPFLHVSHDNLRAKALYDRLGYRLRRNIPFWSLSGNSRPARRRYQ